MADPPTWLDVLSWLALAVAFACAGWIAWDILGRGRRQRMRVMEVVWPVTALYLGPLALWGYLRYGRSEEEHGEGPASAIGTSHCGAGCTLGDILAAWLVFVLAWEVAGLRLYAEYIASFTFAFLLGILFQYLAIAPMREGGVRENIRDALKADTLSIVSFQLGLFGWMAIMQLVFFTDPHLHPNHVAYWALMQVGMAIGFLTSWPVNVWLIRRGVKEAM